MATLDTGAIDNRQEPLTARLMVRVTNTGKQQAIAGIELYYIEPDGGGSGSQMIYHVNLVSLTPLGQAGSTFTVENAYAAFDVIGVRILTSGLGGSNVTAVIEELDDAGNPLASHVLGGQLSQADPQIMVYVATNTPFAPPSKMFVMDTVKNSLLTTISDLPNMSDAAIAPDGTRVYLTSGSTITVVDTATNTVVDSIMLPTGVLMSYLAITPDGLTAYGGSGASVYVLDLVGHTVTDTIPLAPGISLVGEIAISPDGLRVYVIIQGSNLLAVIDTAMNAVVATISLGLVFSLVDLVVSPDNLKVYITAGSGSVCVIDTVSNTLLTSIPVVVGVGGIAITPDGSKVYAASSFDKSLTYINPINNSVLGTIPLEVAGVPFSPHELATTPDGSRLYIASDNLVAVYDTSANAVIGSIPSGFNPVAVVITPILLF